MVFRKVSAGSYPLTLVNCEYGDVRFKQASRIENKLGHWRRIAVSAAAERPTDVPTIAEPLDLVDWLGQQSAETRLCLDPRGAERLGDTPLSLSIALLVGPEGGLSPAEVAALRPCSFRQRSAPECCAQKPRQLRRLRSSSTAWASSPPRSPAGL